MEEELKSWLEDKLKNDNEITVDKMSNLLSRHMSSHLYMSIPSSGSLGDHSEKVNYVMNLIEELNTPKEKLKLNLVIADGSSSMEYIQYLSTDYEVNVVNFKDVKNRKDIDLVLFTGGEDVDPELYGETKGEFTYINKGRDKKEREVFNFFKGYVPMLGVCRGNQLLCVLNGGRLIQHVEGHGRDHTIVVKGYSSPISITSTHHQMVYPFNLKEENYELVAYSEYFKSNTYLNGKNEEIDLPKEFLEPEIVFYPKSKCLGIQGHPEYGSCPPNTKKIYMKLIKKYLLNKDSRPEPSKSWHDNDYYPEDEYIPAHEEPIKYKSFDVSKFKLKDSMSKSSIGINPLKDLSYYGNSDIGIQTVNKTSEKVNVVSSQYDKTIERLKSYLAEPRATDNGVETIISEKDFPY